MPAVSVVGRDINETRRRVAARLPRGARLVDALRLPANARAAVARLAQAREAEVKAREVAHRAAVRASVLLTKCGLGRRDVASLTGFSFQRIQQFIKGSR